MLKFISHSNRKYKIPCVEFLQILDVQSQRGWRFSAAWRPNQGTSWNPSQHHENIMVQRGSRAGPNSLGPPLCREVWASQTADKNSYLVDFQNLNFWDLFYFYVLMGPKQGDKWHSISVKLNGIVQSKLLFSWYIVDTFILRAKWHEQDSTCAAAERVTPWLIRPTSQHK